MKAEQKLQWIAALLSGDYEQGRGRLRTQHDKYCCLGVECDLAAQQGKGKWVNTYEDGEYSRWLFVSGPEAALDTIPWHAMSWSSIPEDLARELGLASVDRHLQSTLQDLNDKHRASFEQIAEWIEENIPVDEESEVTL